MSSVNAEKCQDCGHTFTVSLLRYVRGPDGSWAYLCTPCRKKRRSGGGGGGSDDDKRELVPA